MQGIEEIAMQGAEEMPDVLELVEGVRSLLSDYEGYDFDKNGVGVFGSSDGEIVFMRVGDAAHVLSGLSAGQIVSKAARVLEGLERSPFPVKTAMSTIIAHHIRDRAADPIWEMAQAIAEGRAEPDGAFFEASADEAAQDGDEADAPVPEESEEEEIVSEDEEEAADAPDDAEDGDEPDEEDEDGEPALSWAGDEPAPVHTEEGEAESEDAGADEDAPQEDASPEPTDPISRLVSGKIFGGKGGDRR